MIVCGIDPGLSGAVAFLDGSRFFGVYDMPVLSITRGGKRKREIDARALVRLFELHDGLDAIFMEQVGGMDGDSPFSAFQFGRATGIAEAVAKSTEARFETVMPHKWKRDMSLTGKAKDDSRALAQNIFPKAADRLARVKDDGRAEALLLAEWGRRKLHEQGVFG